MYHIDFIAYCGMSIPGPRKLEREEARKEIARRLRLSRKRGMNVWVVDTGREWEIQNKEEGHLVGDNEGMLCLRHQTFECRECGFHHETQEERNACCQDER